MENEAMEIMENVTEAIVEEATAEMPTVPTEDVPTAGGNIPVVRVAVWGAVLAGAFLLLKKDELKAHAEHRKALRKERKTAKYINQLEKDGYTVIRNEDIVDESIEVCVEEDVD